MAELKRELVKYIRDFIKKDYVGQDSCYICGGKDKLELHHLYGLSELFNTWCEKNAISDITSAEEITKLRVRFAEDLKDKLSNDYLYTLCKQHHTRLHSIYGQRYSNSKTPKILRWLDIQRDKNGNN